MKRLRYVRLSAGRRAAIWGVFLLAAVMGLMCVAVLHMKPHPHQSGGGQRLQHRQPHRGHGGL